jgi:hypothetical protein
MDVSTAYAVLGLKPDSSLDEAKEVFDARANRLQPECVKASLRPGGGPVTCDQSSPPRTSWGRTRSDVLR